MTALYILCGALFCGILFRRLGIITQATAPALPAIVIYFALPPLAFVNAYRIELDAAFLLPALMPWAQFILALAFFRIVGKWTGDQAQIAALVLTCGLSNTSFLGFPILETAYGPNALQTAIVCDQLGSFLVLSTLGIFFATKAAGATPNFFAMAKRLIAFPSFPALLLGFACRAFMLLPENFIAALDHIGSLMVPLALLHLGIQLQWQPNELRKLRSPLTIGLTFKLLLAPTVMLLFCMAQGRYDSIATVTIVEAAMAPMITAGIIATSFGLAPNLCAQITSLGMALSLVTVPLWIWLLRHLQFLSP